MSRQASDVDTTRVTAINREGQRAGSAGSVGFVNSSGSSGLEGRGRWAQRARQASEAGAPTFGASHAPPTRTLPLAGVHTYRTHTRPAGALGLWTITLFFVSNAKNQFKCGTPFFYAMVFLVLGIGSSILVTFTGQQHFHVFIAGGFVGLFFTELHFIIYAVPDSYNTGSNQASV